MASSAGDGGAHLAAAKGTSGCLEERGRGAPHPSADPESVFGASTMLRRAVTSTLRRAAAATARAPTAAAPSAAPAALRALCGRGAPTTLLPRCAAAVATTRGFAARAPPAPPSLGDALRAELAHELDVYETPEASHPGCTASVALSAAQGLLDAPQLPATEAASRRGAAGEAGPARAV